MDGMKVELKRRIRQGAAMMGLGVFLLALDIIFPLIFPASLLNWKWIGGFGVMLLGWGGIYLARYMQAYRDPEMAHRTIVEDLDERNIAIRNQAGYMAFLFVTLLGSFALIIYSAMTRGVARDALWLYMAFMVIAPSTFFVGYLLWLQKH
jgi:hypothetical protein